MVYNDDKDKESRKTLNADIPEPISPGLSDRKLGETLSAVINYEVIEKTKSYLVLRVKYLHLTNIKRKF